MTGCRVATANGATATYVATSTIAAARNTRAASCCTRVASGCYPHRLVGDCGCGQRHDPRPTSAATHERATPRSTIAAIYDYSDAGGALIFQVVRKEPKQFMQRRPNGQGRWAYNLDGVTPVLYRFPAVLAADPAVPVVVVEGEKDADKLAAIGLVATTNAMGAGKWRDSYSEHLRGRHIVVVPDNDDAGREHAHQVAHSLYGVAASVRVLTLDGLPDHGDVSDWLDMGHEGDELRSLIDAAPYWSPPTTAATADEHRTEAARPTLDSAALFGLAGDIVRAIDPETEAHPAAVLVNVLTHFGSAVGRAPHALVGSKRHGLNLFAVLVGRQGQAATRRPRD